MSHRFTCVALSFVSALPFTLWSLWVLSNAFLKFYLVSHICCFKHFLPSPFIDQFVLQVGVGIGGIGMCWEWVPNCFLLIQITHHRQQHFSGLQKRSVELSLFITLLTPQLDPSYAHILHTHLHPFTYPGSLSLGFNWNDVPHCETAQWQWRAPLSGWMRAGVFIRWAWMRSSGGTILRAGGYPRPSGWVKLYVSPASLSSQLPCSSSVFSSSQQSDAWPWKAADAFVGKVGFVCAWRMNLSGAKERLGSKMDHRKAKTTSSHGKRKRTDEPWPGRSFIIPQSAFQTPILPGGPNQNTDYNTAERSDTSLIHVGNILYTFFNPWWSGNWFSCRATPPALLPPWHGHPADATNAK